MFRIITGVVVTLSGLGFAWLGWHEDGWSALFGLFWAGIGVAIILNKREDKIEEITNQSDEHHE